MFTRLSAMTAAFCFTMIGAAQAAEWGDPAAELQLASFVKGEPVTLADGKGEKVYVVEFWATWCGPCRMTIPHLTKLQEKYKDDVIVIGVSDETADVVQPFVNDQGATMDYRVAVDQDQKISAAYMGAYGQTGIPTAFIVDRSGKVAWVGHPAEMDGPLEAIVNGDYDITAVQKERAAMMAAMEKFEEFLKVLQTDTEENALALARVILDDEESHYTLFANVGWALMQHEGFEKRDYSLSRKLLTNAIKTGKDSDRMPQALYYHALAQAYHGEGDIDNAIKYERMAVENEEEERYRLNFEQVLEQYEAEKAGAASVPSPS